jgi:hypothetical protein
LPCASVNAARSAASRGGSRALRSAETTPNCAD